MAYGTVNADSITTSSGPSLGAGNSTLIKNKIINGAMVIDQRNAGASLTPASSTSTYVVDRFSVLGTQSSKFTSQQNQGSVTPPAGFTNYLGITSSSAYTSVSTDLFRIFHQIEGYNIADFAWGTASAKTVTLSFWARSSLTGTFGGCLQNQSNNRAYAFTYQISSANTWTFCSVTVPGETTGTWYTNNTLGLAINFDFGSGSTKQIAPGSWQAVDANAATGCVSVVGTSGATLYITGVQLEIGSVATGYEYRQYGQELALCQRYFWRKSGIASAVVTVGSGMAYNTTDIRCVLVNPVTMRATPSVSFTGSNFEYEKTASARGTLSSVDATARSPEASTLFSGSGTTSTTAGQGAIWYITDSASYISISAEI